MIRKEGVKKRFNLFIPIGVQLITITTILLLLVTGYIARISSDEFAKITFSREEDTNRSQASARATEVESLMVGYVDKVKIIASLLLKPYQTPEEKEKALELTFRQDRDLVTVEVLKLSNQSQALRVVNESYLRQYGLNKKYIERLRKYQKQSGRFQPAAVFAGQVEVRNASLPNGAPLLTLGIPLVINDLGQITHVAVADIRLDRLQKAFSNVSERLIFLIDKDGTLLAHPKENMVFRAANMASIPIVNQAIRSKLKQQQLRYEDDSGERFTGAFSKTALGIAVISQASEDVILEAARNVKREAYFIAGKALSIALFMIFAFSITLTTPIEKLVEVTREVARGNFTVKSNVKSKDEVGQLARSFDQMIEGLQERDKVKNMLNKFHGSSVAEDLLKGDLALGGSRKPVTVFFSDIRDFTKFSEGHSPEEVVEMLNEYFQIMVGIINKHNGIVDKFIGDAIMAIWGAPNASETDAKDCVRACLEMRKALAHLNELRIGRGQVPIKIGMGVHSGDAISGTIGSEERMEYTVIGDTVNEASRIEASTKAFGTDLLLSKETMELVKADMIIEDAGKVEVKGKSQALELFKVRGYLDENAQAVEITTEYSDYEAGAADKVKMAS